MQFQDEVEMERRSASSMDVDERGGAFAQPPAEMATVIDVDSEGAEAKAGAPPQSSVVASRADANFASFMYYDYVDKGSIAIAHQFFMEQDAAEKKGGGGRREME